MKYRISLLVLATSFYCLFSSASFAQNMLRDSFEKTTTVGGVGYTQPESCTSPEKSPGGQIGGDVQLVDGKVGKAARMHNAAWIEYPSVGNISPLGGEISFWFRLDFDPNANTEANKNELRNQLFVEITGPGRAKVAIYTCLKDVTYCVTDEQGNIASCGNSLFPLKEGEWHFVRFSWGKEITLTCDDKKMYNTLWNGLFGSIPVDWSKSQIVVGSRPGIGIVSEYTIDELNIKGPDEKSIASRARISLPLIKDEPVMDGKLDDEYWKKSARVTGFVGFDKNELVTNQPTVYAAYNEKGIYIGLDAILPPGNSPRASLTQHDSAIYTEDSFELFLQPQASDPSYYQFISSAIGTQLDSFAKRKIASESGIADIAFNTEWTVKTSSHVGGWSAEVFIPYSSIKVANMPQPGDVWKGNFCVDSSAGFGNAATWSFTNSNFNVPIYFGELLFTGNSRTIRQENFGGFVDGDPQETQTLVGDIAPVVTVKADLFDSTGTKVKNISSPLRDFHSVDLKPGFLTTGYYNLNLSAVEPDGKTLFYQSFGFRTAKALSLTAENYPYAGYILLKTDVKGLKGAADNVVCTLTGQDNKVISSVKIVDFKTGAGEGKLPSESLLPSEYQIEANALASDGKSLATAKQVVKIFTKPSWWKSNLGIDHSVPPPFQAVVVKNGNISVWGRDHIFGATVFPQQIINQKNPMFTRAPIFTLKVDGQSGNLASMKKTDSKVFPDIATVSGKQTIGSVTASCKTSLEFDGCIRLDLSITPVKPVNLEEMVLTIPLKPEMAKFLLSSNGATCSLTEIGKGYIGGFSPYIWLGNDHGGLAFFTESDQFWAPKEKAAIEVIPGLRETLLRINFVNLPYKLDKTAIFTLGLMTSPVKQIPVNDPFRYTSHGVPPDFITFPEHVTYPIPDGFSKSEGTFEFWCKRSKVKASSNTRVFEIVGENRTISAFLLTPSEPGKLAISTGNERILTADVNITPDKFTHIAYSWDKYGLSLYVDGKLYSTSTDDPFSDLVLGPQSKIRLGSTDEGSYCGLLYDEVRLSNISRYSREFAPPESAYKLDGSTLILDHMDKSFKPDGQDAVTEGGGVPSIGCQFQPGKFGKGIMVQVAQPVAALDMLKKMQTKVLLRWFMDDTDHVEYSWPPTLFRQILHPYKEKNKPFQAAGIKTFPYVGFPALGMPSELGEQFASEWAINPVCTMPYSPPEGHYFLNSCLNAKGDQDYYAEGTKWVMDTLGYDGAYTDGLTHIYACQNVNHGCGYFDKDGNLHPTWPFFGTREGIKRMYRVIKAKDPNGMLVNHMSFNTLIPTLSFSDAIYAGEHENYEDPLTGRLRFNSTPWGIYVVALGASEHYYSPLHTMVCLLSGTTVWGMGYESSRRDMERKYDNLRVTYQSFPVKTAKWVPYFEGESILYKSSDNNIKASIYYHSGKDVLIVVGNFSQKRIKSNIRLDLSKFKLQSKKMKATNALTGQDVPMNITGVISPVVNSKSFVPVKITLK